MMNVPRGKMIPASWKLNQMPAIMMIGATLMLLMTMMTATLLIGNNDIRHEICHKHHKQRLCKIFTTWVKFYFGNVLSVQFKSYYFGILVISTNLNQCQIRNEHLNTTIGVLFSFLRSEML